MSTRELVRCGCGVVRNDEDANAKVLFYWAKPPSGATGLYVEGFEFPRVCRGCSCIYMLPKPQAPTVPK